MGLVAVKVVDVSAQTDSRVYDRRPNGAASIGGILLHHTGSSNEAGDQEWLSHWHTDPVSIHKLIKRDGTIVQIVPDADRAWHAGVSTWRGRSDCNSWMVGYEICNRGDGVEPFTDAQYETVAQSVAYQCALYRIPDSCVARHLDVCVPPGRKDDPRGFDMARMWRRVTEIRTSWPAGWPAFWCCNG